MVATSIDPAQNYATVPANSSFTFLANFNHLSKKSDVSKKLEIKNNPRGTVFL